MSTAEYLQQVVTALATGIGFRTYEEPDRLERAAQYISREFASFGYRVSDQPFIFRGRAYRNIVADVPRETVSDAVLVIGAHYDSVRTTPGADDNASGIAGLLGLARLLAKQEMRTAVRFVAFALEEMPVYRTRNMASYHYAEYLDQQGVHVEGMICLEMIGYFSDEEGSQSYPLPFFSQRYPAKGNFIAIVGNTKSKEFISRIAKNFQDSTDLPVVTLSAPPVVVGIDFSDHWSFGKFGYPACMVTDTAFYRNKNYHAPTDLPETLDYERMAKVVEGLRGAVARWGR
jgi:Zn-dependent M28 family amino/carboxypeptidase